MVVGYGVIAAVSILLIVLYQTLIRKKDFWLGFLFVCVAVVNLGYFLLSLAPTVGFAVFANDLAYLGSVFLSLCMFLTIAGLCGFAVRRPYVVALLSAAVLMFLIVATSGILPWYYESIEIQKVNGATVLCKEYGVLHPLYLVYLVSYFLAMITAIVHSAVKKRGEGQKFAGALAVIVLINLAVWFTEKFTSLEFELLSVSYVVSEVMFVLLYWMMQDYVPRSAVPINATAGLDVATLPMAEKIGKVLLFVKQGETLAPREREILERILGNMRRREIADELCLSENTVKTYTRTLYAKLGVGSREELYALLLQEW